MDRTVIKEALMNHDPYDQFAWVQGWRFAIAAYQTDQGETVPGFRQPYSGCDSEEFEYEMLVDIQPTMEALWYASKVLERFRRELGRAGKDY